MSYLLDTNVISELRKPRPDQCVRVWAELLPANSLYLSVMVIGEIRRGIERLGRRDAIQAQRFEVWLVELVRRFDRRILPVTLDVAEEWGRMGVRDPLPTADGLMAATAKVHGLTMATRNTADFSRMGVLVVNPFDPR